MIYINDVAFTTDLGSILTELQKQLSANDIQLLQRCHDSNNDIMVSCPYHKNGQEHRPSAGIRKSDGMFHCFACGETHTLPEMISFCLGYQDLGQTGYKWLVKNFAAVKMEDRNDIKLDMHRDNSVGNSNNLVCDFCNPVRGGNIFKRVDSKISEQELDSYRCYHPYMWVRKLTPEIVEKFDIGYDQKTDCLTFPVRDIYGKTLFIARRSVKTKYFHYPPQAEKPVYGLYELMQLLEFPKEIIICESILDALTCWVYGRYAVALNGLGTELQFAQLNSLPCRKLILATDNDDAGTRARTRIRKKLGTYKLISEYVLPDDKKDINELTKNEFYNLLEIF